MGNTLRIIFATCFALFLLSGCSLFNDAIENCEEPQEYQESNSIPPLIVPNYLKNIQNKSIFNIPNSQASNAFSEESFIMPMISEKSLDMPEQNNQMGIIDGDELSELLQLIDQTISNRQLEGQYDPIYENVTGDYESNPSTKPCLDGPPKYFSEKISPRSMPSQTYTRPSDESEATEEEKSRRQKRREKRQQKTGKQQQEGAEEDADSKDSEDSVEAEEDKVASIFKVITDTAIGLYTGGQSVSSTLSGGTSVASAEPTKPGDVEIIEAAVETGVEEAAAEKIRNLALLDPALNDEQRVAIQNMSDKQILEMVAVITKQVEDQDSTENEISDDEIIEEKEATVEEDDWFTQVKDQWTKGKAQREERREARQQRRAERQAQDD